MQFFAMGHAFDGPDILTIGFDGKHKASTNQPVVQRDRTSAAIARCTALLRAGQAKRPAQGIEHGIVRFAEKLHWLGINGGGNVQFRHVNYLALSLLCALRGDCGGTLQQHARYFRSIGYGTALVIDWTADVPTGVGGYFKSFCVEARADQRVRCCFD